MSNSSSKQSGKQEVLSHADYNLIFENKEVDGIAIELLEIGDLVVTSGQIVVCDPLVSPDAPPLTKIVKPGKYPIKIYIAKFKDWGDRYAIAKLEFSTHKADKWVLALRNGEDVSELNKESDFFGFPVDAGLGGFFDYQTGIEYNKFLDDFSEKNPDGNIYDDFFAAKFNENAIKPDDPSDIDDWINYQLPNSELNISMFHSGFGDGVYPAYWGMTTENKIVSLVIDFHVLLLPDE